MAKTTKTAKAARPKRAYTRGFRPRAGDRSKDPATWGAEYKMNRIPIGFWRSVQAKAKRDGVSLRGLLLTYLQGWLDEKPGGGGGGYGSR